MSEHYARPDSLAWQEIPQIPVYQAASATLRHPFLYGFLFEGLRPVYRVPDRRTDGSVAGERRTRWLLGKIVMPVRIAIGFVADLLLDTSSAPDNQGIVTGPAASRATSFADAHRLAAGPVWLLWSVHRVVLVRATDGQPLRLDLLWSGDGESKPAIDTTNAVLRWSDGSSIELRLSKPDRELLARQRSV